MSTSQCSEMQCCNKYVLVAAELTISPRACVCLVVSSAVVKERRRATDRVVFVAPNVGEIHKRWTLELFIPNIAVGSSRPSHYNRSNVELEENCRERFRGLQVEIHVELPHEDFRWLFRKQTEPRQSGKLPDIGLNGTINFRDLEEWGPIYRASMSSGICHLTPGTSVVSL